MLQVPAFDADPLDSTFHELSHKQYRPSDVARRDDRDDIGLAVPGEIE